MSSFTDNRHLALPLFNQKLNHQEQAIFAEVKKYKKQYLQQEINVHNIQNFYRFSKETIQIITSYCKNMIDMAPQKVLSIIYEFNIVAGDILLKYYHEYKKNNCILGEASSESRNSVRGELCVFCGQKVKKVQIDSLRKYMLNENNNQTQNNYEQQVRQVKQIQQDLAFFTQLNQVLNRKHSQIIKNQIEINIYKDIALDSIKSMTSLNNFFSRESILMPNHAWMSQARKQMESMLKCTFGEKLTPWIQKMLYLFGKTTKSEKIKRERQAQVQTDLSTNSDLMQLRKKVLLCNDKIQKDSHLLKSRDNEIFQLNTNVKELQSLIQYYKGEQSKLLQEISIFKLENQGIKEKLQRVDKRLQQQKRSKQTIFYDSYKNISELKRNSRNKFQMSDHQGLPSIRNEISRFKRQSQISIATQNLSNFNTKRKSKERVTHFRASQEKSVESRMSIRRTTQEPFIPTLMPSFSKEKKPSEDNVQSQSIKYERNDVVHCNLYENEDNIITQEQIQPVIEDQRKKVEQAGRIMRENMIKKHKSERIKKLLNSTFSGNTKQNIKKVPHKQKLKEIKNQMESHAKSVDEIQDATQVQKNRIKQAASQYDLQVDENLLGKIYQVLKQKGYLTDINVQAFKESLLKIKELQLLSRKEEASPQLQEVKTKRNTVHGNDRSTSFAKRWNSHMYYIQQKTQPIKNIDTTISSYFALFNNQQNAYHYELSLTKNHLRGFAQLNRLQNVFCQQLYEIIQRIKGNNNKHYRQFCSLIRYPYQMVANDFGMVDLVSQMKYASFHQYFQRILAIHTKCPKSNHLCSHLTDLKSALLKNSVPSRLNE